MLVCFRIQTSPLGHVGNPCVKFLYNLDEKVTLDVSKFDFGGRSGSLLTLTGRKTKNEIWNEYHLAFQTTDFMDRVCIR